jgi:TonB family protein
MLANANPLEAVPASRSVREFVAVCARHNVPYGDLNCLPALLRELGANKHFAMHFWSVVAGMVDKQSATQEAVLTAIVEAVTRRTPAEVREAGPAHRIVLERLGRMLAGQEVEPEQIADAEPKDAAATERVAERTATAVPGDTSEDVLPIRRVAVGKRGRTRRRAAVEPEPIAPVTNPAWTRDESLRLVLRPESPVAENANRPAAGPLTGRNVAAAPRNAVERPMPVPLSSYAEEETRRSSAAAVLGWTVAMAILAGCGYLFVRGGGTQTLDRLGTSMRAGYDSAVANWHGEPTQPAANAPASDSAAVTPPSAAVPSPIQPTPPAPEPSTAAAPVSQTPTPVQVPTQNAKPGGSGLTPAQSMAATAAYSQQSEAPGAAVPTIGAGGLVQVPEGAMNAHLIASRVPVLPDDARAKGVTGVVRMQATINRSGFVSRLHVLQGPTELRHPALSAVSAWRYRPYLVNGQPMDVMTTITVDFSSLE